VVRRRRSRFARLVALLRLALVLAVLAAVVRFGNDALRLVESSAPSESRGTPERGSLVHGRRLPSSGGNFVVYSYAGALLGRNSVHAAVRAAVLEAYDRLRVSEPDVRWVYGETGWPRGGPFRPHRTHENGLSVDFMVPVRNEVGRSERLPAWPWTKFGYALDFDGAGRGRGFFAGGLRIDFEAVAAHLAALAATAPRHGLAVDVVIFAPELQRALLESAEGRALRGRVRFSRRPAWVRHDEHYHVDFRIVDRTIARAAD
jgi:penicillin-insensitive murein endopeptidase